MMKDKIDKEFKYQLENQVRQQVWLQVLVQLIEESFLNYD